jgi:hypothetical protein
MTEEKAVKMVEKGQIRRIHTLKTALKLQDEKYRKLIYANYYPCTSSKDLTFDQAVDFIKNLECMAIAEGVWAHYEGKSKFEELGRRSRMATPAQLRMIERIWKEVSVAGDEQMRQKALRIWLFNHFKVSDLRFLDTRIVRKVIHALRAMQLQKAIRTKESACKAFSRDKR